MAVRLTHIAPPPQPSPSRGEGAGFCFAIILPGGNRYVYEYDAANPDIFQQSNLIAVTHYPDPSRGGDQAWVKRTVEYAYDALNRIMRNTDSLGQTRRFYYDSRGLAIRATDALGPAMADPLGLYSGQMRLYIDDVLQADVKAISGEVKLSNSPLLLGGIAFKSSLEEIRVSNCVRSRVNLLQKFYYDGWRLIEEREHVAVQGEPLCRETIRRQFVDGALGIDEHLCTWIYDDSGTVVEGVYYYHENHRGDTVALTDASGAVVLRCAYSAYGIPLEIDRNGQLRPLQDVTLVRFGFQGRELDEETGLYYFRNSDMSHGEILIDGIVYSFVPGSENLGALFGEPGAFEINSLDLTFKEKSRIVDLKGLTGLQKYLILNNALGFLSRSRTYHPG